MANITVEAVQATAQSQTQQKNLKVSNFDEKNYLNVRLEKGEEKKELRIRLLPIDKDSSTPFKIIHMHSVKVPTEISKSGWKSYVCLNKTEDIDHDKLGNKCPFCELRYEAYKRSTEAENDVEKQRWQKISFANKPIDVCVVRCIERGHEEDGPKFWKFALHAKKDDAYHRMMDLFETRRQEGIEDGDDSVNIFDLYNGKDLKITINAVYEDGKWTNKTTVSVTDYGKEKPLSTDETQMEEWINDEKKWSDVFVAKPYEYLSIVLDGDVPYFDSTTGQWVKKNKTDEQPVKSEVEAIEKEIQVAQEQIIDETQTSDDLPF